MSKNTTFRFKATKCEGEGKDKSYAVDLHQDILDGVDEEEIISLATEKKIIQVQDHKGLMRASASADEAKAQLILMGYVNATVTGYIPSPTVKKEVTIESIKKSISDGKMTREQLTAMLASLS